MEKERKIKSGLTPTEIRKFKAILFVKRNEILGNMSCMEAEAFRRERSDLSNMPIHMADIGTDNYEIENTLGLMDSERRLLTEIDDALQRMEEGVYGICEGSGKPIPKTRLEAIPWARYCVEYASLLEKGLVKKNETRISFGFNYETDDDQDKIPQKFY